MTDDITLDDVVPFLRLHPPEVPVTKVVDHGFCPHHATELNMQRRTVTCQKCGAQLDPYAVLLMCTQSPDRFKWFAIEERRLRAEVEGLEAEVRKLRAARNALRRAKAPK